MLLLKSILGFGLLVALSRACTPKSETAPPKGLRESGCILHKANLETEKFLGEIPVNSFDDCKKECKRKHLCNYFGFNLDNKECKLYLYPTKTSPPSGNVYFGRPHCEEEAKFTDFEPYPCSSKKFSGNTNFESFYKNVEHSYCKKALAIIADSNNKIFKSLYNVFKGDHENLLFSPYSVINMLLLFVAGIEPKASSKTQILKAAGLQHLEDSLISEGMNWLQSHTRASDVKYGRTVSGNRIYYSTHHATARGRFLQTITKFITNTSAVPTDFYEKTDTMNLINDWVKGATNNLITELVDENTFSEETVLMFLNAVFFQGNWEHQFPVQMTHVSQFRMPNKQSAGVFMMEQTNDYATVSLPELDAEAIELKYVGGKNSMIIILPNTVEGLPHLENNLMNFDFKKLQFGEKKELELQFPKFAFDSVFKLDEALQQLNITKIFNPQEAKFERFSDNGEIFVSDIIQKSVIKVDEVGTVAASVTAGGMTVTSRKPVFKVDHPFFFLIRDNPTGMILFGGRITDATTLNQ